jgi:hypothetical protein
MRVRVAVLLTLPLLLAPSCSSGKSHKATGRTTTTVTSSPAPTSTSTTSATTIPFAGSTEATSSTGTTSTTAFLRTVTITHIGGIDRVTFQFEGGSHPTASLAYVDHPAADGSGAPVQVKGGAALKVRFEPASTTDLSGENPRRVYTGPDRVTGGSKAVTEVVKGGDFEGVLTWFIGVRATTPFRIVLVPSAPAQVTIELAAPD